MVHTAQAIAEELSKHDINAAVIDLYRLKPVNDKLLLEMIGDFKRVVTLEENTIIGGLGSLVAEVLADSNQQVRLKRIALRDEQCFHYGDRDWLHKKYQLDRESVFKEIVAEFNKGALADECNKAVR